MIVQCENCQTKFRVDEDRIKEQGSRVRCSVCKSVFTVFREAPEAEAEELQPQEYDMDELKASPEDLAPAVQQETGYDEGVLPPRENDLRLRDLERTASRKARAEPAGVVEEELEDKDLKDTVILGEQEAPEEEDLEKTVVGLEEEPAEETDYEPSPAVDYREDAVETEAREEFVLEPEELPAPAIAPPAPRKGRALLWILIFFLALVAAAAGVNYYQPGLLPSLIPGQAAKVEPDLLGRNQIHLDPKLTKDSWKKNQTAGQLLVITGLAKNLFTEPRSYIQLRGILNGGPGEILARKMIYCGNVLADEELETLSMEEINRRLQERAGSEGTNTKVPPGQSVAFMMVFDNVPDTLTGYVVEVVGSQPAQTDKAGK